MFDPRLFGLSIKEFRRLHLGEDIKKFENRKKYSLNPDPHDNDVEERSLGRNRIIIKGSDREFKRYQEMHDGVEGTGTYYFYENQLYKYKFQPHDPADSRGLERVLTDQNGLPHHKESFRFDHILYWFYTDYDIEFNQSKTGILCNVQYIFKPIANQRMKEQRTNWKQYFDDDFHD
jgi:hypothetical protein